MLPSVFAVRMLSILQKSEKFISASNALQHRLFKSWTIEEISTDPKMERCRFAFGAGEQLSQSRDLAKQQPKLG
jgi:hypothetical protein